MVRRQQPASPMSEFLGISAAGVILVFGGMLVVRGSLDAGGFVAFLAMFSQITRPVRSFIDQFATINQGIAAGERIFAVLDAQPGNRGPARRENPSTACTTASSCATCTSPTMAHAR